MPEMSDEICLRLIQALEAPPRNMRPEQALLPSPNLETARREFVRAYAEYLQYGGVTMRPAIPMPVRAA